MALALAAAAAALAGSLHVRAENASAKTWSGCETRGSAAIGNAMVSAIASRSGGQMRRRNRSYDPFPFSPAQFSLLSSSASSSSSSSYRRIRDSTRSSPHRKSRRPRLGRRRG